jgi:pyridoxine kinase
MGDRPAGQPGRIFIRPGIPEFLRASVASADVATPNAFELETLLGQPVHDLRQAIDAARRLGPSLVVVKSVRRRPGSLTTVAVTPTAAWAVETPELDVPSFGAGDTFAALFLGHWIMDRNPAAALAASVSSIHAILAATGPQGRELALIAAQDHIADPRPRFAAEAIG